MKTTVWVLIYLGVYYVTLSVAAFFGVPIQANAFVAIGVLAGALTNAVLKRIRREP